MTAVSKTLTGASFAKEFEWNSIDWKNVRKQVKYIQVRIAKAVREKRFGKAKALQRLLTRSFYGKLLAVKKITENKGHKTPGVDGIRWQTPKQKAKAVMGLRTKGYQTQPLRRIYIPKRNGKKRPLSIPTMKCRAMQALHLLGLEPVSEELADPNAYGFRPKRSAADAIGQCFIALSKKTAPTWILEGDIRSCFDTIDHNWLLKHTLMDKKILKKWLKAGYIDKSTLCKTEEGTPQGGIISPCLLTITLAGLEQEIKSKWPVKTPYKVNVVTYADDFIITGCSKELLEKKVIPIVKLFLLKRGLELSEEKTLITHIDEGFDFLGFNIRKYKGKLLIKPSKQRIKDFLNRIRTLIKKSKSHRTEVLIRQLNPKVKGWSNYYRHVVSKAVFKRADHLIFKSLWRWCVRRHPKKNRRWVKNKYFRNHRNDNWAFSASCNKGIIYLEKMRSIPIKRHIKVKSQANPYNPLWFRYFMNRAKNRKAGSANPGLCEA